MRKCFVYIFFFLSLVSCKMNQKVKDSIYAEAMQKAKENNYRAAINIIESKIKGMDRDYLYYAVYGSYVMYQDRLIFSGEALPYLKKAYELNNNTFAINDLLGTCYYSMEEYNLAVKYYERSCVLYKTGREIEPSYYYLADSYFHLDNYNKALEYNTMSIQNPEGNIAENYIQRGMILSSIDNDIGVLNENYKKAKEIDNKDLWIDRQYAWQLVMLGDYEEAEKMYKKFISENDKNNWAYTELGYSAMLQGKWEDAFRLLKKAESLNYGYKECLRYLSFYYFFHEKNYSQAYDYGGTERLMNSVETRVYEWKSPEAYIKYYKNNKYFQKLLKLYPVN